MEFRDVIDGMKEQIYGSWPQDADMWQNDVWERVVRPQSAAGFRKVLRKHVEHGLSSKAAIEAFEAIRTDMFVTRSADRVDASIAQFVPPPESSDPFDVIEVLELVRNHVGYKLSKWGSLTQLEELVGLCERIPRFNATEYMPTVKGTLSFMAYSAAMLECDVDTKPNFATMQQRVKLFSVLNRFGSRLLSAFGDQESA